MKRWIAGVLALALVLALAGCAAKTQKTEEPDAGQTRTFVDSAGREVTLPEKIERIIPSGDMAQMFLWPLASDKLVSVSTHLTAEQEAYLGDETADLPETGNLYKTGSELNIEQVAALDADLIVDFGEPKDSIAADLDELQDLLGVPCVFIAGELETTGEAYRMLGELLGMEEEAEALASYIDEVVGTAKTVFETTEKKQAVILNGQDGLGCVASGTYFDELWAFLLDNVAVVEESQMYASTSINFEQLATWNPDYLFFYNCEDPATIVDADSWSQLTAVQQGHYYGVPGGPYSFVSPPSINRYLAIVWLAETVYPEAFDWDLQEMVTEFYKLFYHCDLDDAAYQALMETTW